MKYKVVHTTTYQYSSPVNICQNLVILAPRETPWLTCQNHRLTIRPTPTTSFRRTDAFGNIVHSFSLEESHTQLSITATSRVTVEERSYPVSKATVGQLTQELSDPESAEWLQTSMFLFDSPRIRRGPRFRDFVLPFLNQDRPILEAITDFNTHVHHSFKYDKTATVVDTPTEVAFDGRHGVCQDFAHVVIACLRSAGFAARYVSGYLRTLPPEGKERLVGADQSHAWVSVYGGEHLGWIDIDPTNNCLCSTDHIPIAWGRDYSDVVPIRGIFLGGGEQQQTVSVDVAPL
ncbi:MAG: transglutaminase family protein [Planctomycetaceae bacterium]|nr:transglutaminase family protein [Planctomycetaceae bacterium]